jgi:hypothetical protein
MHCPCPDEIKINEDNQHIGDIHFTKDNWDTGIIAHEAFHAMLWFIRGLVVDFARILYLNWTEEEETMADQFELMNDWLHEWLWKKNPNPKWQKESN